MSLHNKIMSLSTTLEDGPGLYSNAREAYMQGYRDARKAAAQLVGGVDAEIERLRDALADIRDNESGPWCRETAREALDKRM